MNALNVKPSDKLVKDYYAALGQYSQLHLDHEGTVRSAFQVAHIHAALFDANAGSAPCSHRTKILKSTE